MSVKIATPISTLFKDSQNKIELLRNISDIFELRDHPAASTDLKPLVYHSDLSIVAYWSDFIASECLTKFKAYPSIEHISFHALSCYEDYVIDAKARFQPGKRRMTEDFMLENARKNIQLVKKIAPMLKTISIENNNYFPTGAYETVTESAFLRRLIMQNKISLLLDLAHAEITASYKGLPLQTYLDGLPLNSVAQIHLSSPGRNADGFSDDHKELTDIEWSLLEALLPQCPNLKFVTIEYYKNFDSLLKFSSQLNDILYEFAK